MSESTVQDETLAGEPIVERIRSNIVATLKELTTAGGQYANAIVYEPNPAKPPAMADYRLTVVQEDPDTDDPNATIGEDDETIGVPGGLMSWRQPFSIDCLVVLPEDATDPIDRRLNRVQADVEKKLRENPKRGLNAAVFDTIILPCAHYDTEETGRIAGVIVRCEVRYRAYEDDPYGAPGI